MALAKSIEASIYDGIIHFRVSADQLRKSARKFAMLTANQFKKKMKDALPHGVLQLIQDLRTKWNGPHPKDVAARREFDRLNAACAADQIVMREGMTWTIHPESREAFQYFCYKSRFMVAEFDLMLAAREGKSAYLDIGANHGVFSLAFTHGRAGVQSLAIEPSPLAFPVLQHNIAANPGCQIRAVQVAAGDVPGQLRMRVNWHHLEVISDQTAGASDQIKIVPVRPMDDVCEELGYVPDLIKVDVEGFELQCLRGLRRTLERTRAELFLEIHPEFLEPLGHSPADIVRLVGEMGYGFWGMNSQPMDPAWLADSIHTMWVYCKPRTS
jgi:FkbM family methyltransferase